MWRYHHQHSLPLLKSITKIPAAPGLTTLAARKKKKRKIATALILKGTGNLIHQIPLSSIGVCSSDSVTHENLTTLTSYSLLRKRAQTIVVPGYPSLWTPKPLPAQVDPDTGPSICDAAAHVFPHCPLEPLLRALFTTLPDFDPTATDLITDRRNLRSLLDFVSSRGRHDFRIDVQLARTTLLFSCRSKRSVVYAAPGVFAGHGHGFEAAFTTAPKAAISHSRVLAYALGGLKIIMRFEVDGCVADTGGLVSGGGARSRARAAPGTGQRTQYRSGLIVRCDGQNVDPSRIIEIKTGRAGGSVRNGTAAQMWFSQTPILFRGLYAQGGKFSSVREVHMLQEGKLAAWAEANSAKIRMLVRLVEMVAEVVKKRPRDRHALVYFGRSDLLQIYSVRAVDSPGLPLDLMKKWGS